MPLTIIVGAQWGDEGKGRVVDLLAANADIVARYYYDNGAVRYRLRHDDEVSECIRLLRDKTRYNSLLQ